MIKETSFKKNLLDQFA